MSALSSKGKKKSKKKTLSRSPVKRRFAKSKKKKKKITDHPTGNRSGKNLALKWQNIFMNVLRETGNISLSCRKANVTRQNVYVYRDTHPEFATLMAEAQESLTDALEQSVVQLSISGYTEDVYGKDGYAVGTRQRYMPAERIFLLKKRRPEVYSDDTNLATNRDPEETARIAMQFLKEVDDEGMPPPPEKQEEEK